MTTNANIKQLSILIDPTDDLNDSLNAFDKVISDTFGDEVAHITHQLWSEHTSFTSVKFVNDEYIGFRVSAKGVIDDTYRASNERLYRAFKAFNIEMPYWMMAQAHKFN
jgi:hypothetical protein